MSNYANERPIIFSSFQPDAAKLIRKLQNDYPVRNFETWNCFAVKYVGFIMIVDATSYTQVFFLSNGGTEIYRDPRRNSLDEAIKLCLENGLQGVVSEVKAIFRNPSAVAKIKEANLVLFTYGQLK